MDMLAVGWPRLLRRHWQRLLLVYGLAVGVLAGPAYTMYVHYDFSHSLDTRSYLSVARGEFRDISITRRYRVLVPAVAAAVAWPLETVYARVWPQRAATEWPLRLAFYVVNTLVLAAAGLLWYQGSRCYGATREAAALAMLLVLSSRWAVYIAGLPIVDSLYMLVFALGFYATASHSRAALVACILLGPLAKESFVFLVPWLLVFGQRAGRWPVQLAWLALSGALTLALRYWIDAQAATPTSASVHNALNHFENVTYSLSRLLSVKGAGEMFSAFGFATLALLLVPARVWARPLGWGGAALGAVVGVHMLLSSELARMAYLFAPAFTVALALVITQLQRTVQSRLLP
ncbi:hypothetical protein [Hymenobacter guriensis]|uniref:DUF2029 domain-containing protein n=1 Tax=Hymenobacter guriensis TaxID=2793065 RepID=A0ABS0L299_9BACT|nr:hypothetical protein [Hymenobacter guriensis]MBG8554244.1 hypothetical protein [Hymenobacter guriensis]